MRASLHSNFCNSVKLDFNDFSVLARIVGRPLDGACGAARRVVRRWRWRRVDATTGQAKDTLRRCLKAGECSAVGKGGWCWFCWQTGLLAFDGRPRRGSSAGRTSAGGVARLALMCRYCFLSCTHLQLEKMQRLLHNQKGPIVQQGHRWLDAVMAKTSRPLQIWRGGNLYIGDETVQQDHSSGLTVRVGQQRA
jgi:hypothetical protein